MIGQVFIDPRYTLPAALLVAALLAAYWVRLGRPSVPESRRRVRRVSLFFMALSLPAFVRGLSYIDPRLQPAEFIITWTAATFLLLLVIGTALADAVVSVRLHQKEFEKDIVETGLKLREAAEREQEQAGEAAEPGDAQP